MDNHYAEAVLLGKRLAGSSRLSGRELFAVGRMTGNSEAIPLGCVVA
jgi:hypothetical protein